jgi:general secretion pathway protein A
MYKQFFGLDRNPFELSPDPSFICPSEKNNEALSLISYAISQRKGFIALTGEVGTGKTLMLRCLFESWRREGIAFANIFAPKLPVIDFLTYVVNDLGIETAEAEPTKGNLLRAFYAFVSAQCAKGLTTVLVIDEAHQAPTHVLEEIRMLTNVETNEGKLVQVLLVGQPELDDRLDSFELRQLKQRIAVRCHLEPLREEETRQYIEQRLRIAGADPARKRIFPPETIQHIYLCSRGIPRIVNSICDQALITACSRHVHVVTVEIVDEVASRFRFTPASAPSDVNVPSAALTHSTAPGNPGNGSTNNAGEIAQERGRNRSGQPASVVPAVWRSWPSLLRRVALIGGAAAVPIGLSIAGFALFHRSPNTLAYSAPSAPASLVAGPKATDQLDASTLVPTGSTVPAPAPGPEARSLPAPVAEPNARSLGKVVQPESDTPKPASNPVEDLSPSRPKIVLGNLSKPIAKPPLLSISSAAVPTLGAQENLSAGAEISSLGATLNGPAAPPTGGHLQALRLISSPPPAYPIASRSGGIQGVVVIDALVDATGKVKDMKVISGPTALIKPAMDALRTWKYEPARLDDQPIEVHTTVKINFSQP